MLRPALAAALTLLPVLTAQGSLQVEQWADQGNGDNPGFFNLSGTKDVTGVRPPDIVSVQSIIDFTDDPKGFPGEIPGSSPWPLAAAHGDSGVTGGPWNFNFVARITTTLTITEDDTYYFRTYADDGVQLRIGKKKIIVDDHYHAPKVKVGSIHLKPGNYPLELIYFNGTGTASLELSMAKGEAKDFLPVGTQSAPRTDTGVPEGGATTGILLGVGLGTLGLIRRRMKRARL